MITSIVVPIDDGHDSERSIPVAGALARMTGATMELVSVDPVGSAPERSQRRLDEVAARIPRGIAVSTTVEDTADSVAVALATLDRDQGAILCLATHGRGALVALALGSVTNGLVDETTMPVLIIGPRCIDSGPSDLMAPAVAALDGSEVDHEVMDAAARWVTATGAPLTITTVVDRPSEPEAWDDADRILAWGEERASALAVPVTTSVVAATGAEEGILRAVEGRVGCVVVGSHRRGRVTRLVFGSTVTRLTQHAPCPVLVAARTHSAPTSAPMTCSLDA
ncbi:MAG TPA: universal stress protein [Iamia sp.]|nr:universal stress protein [Iamia sp.]